MDEYPTVDGQQRFELEIKRSRFVTSIASVEGRPQALAFIQQIRNEMSTASHHCWAFIAGVPDDVTEMDQSDDGEPRGSAGKPMLNVLQHSGFGNIAVVVTRYFGGIKLGVGGLVRAYSAAVNEALSQAKVKQKTITLPLEVDFPYDMQGKLDFYLGERQIAVVDKVFTDRVVYRLQVPRSRFDVIGEQLQQLAQGRLRIIPSN